MDRKSKKQKRQTAIIASLMPHLPAIPDIPIRSSSMRPHSKKEKVHSLRKYVVLPDIGNAVNSVIRGNDKEYLSSSASASAELSEHEKAREAASFLTAADRARLFGINKWY